MDPECRWMLMWSNKPSRCSPKRHMKAMDIKSFFWKSFIHMTVLIWTRIYSHCNQAQGGLCSLIYMITFDDPAAGSMGLFAHCSFFCRKKCQRCLQSTLRRLVMYSLTRTHTPITIYIYILYTRLVQHRKWKGTCSGIGAPPSWEGPCFDFLLIKIYLHMLLPTGAAPIVTCGREAGSKLGRSGEIHGSQHASGWRPGGATG